MCFADFVTKTLVHLLILVREGDRHLSVHEKHAFEGFGGFLVVFKHLGSSRHSCILFCPLNLMLEFKLSVQFVHFCLQILNLCLISVLHACLALVFDLVSLLPKDLIDSLSDSSVLSVVPLVFELHNLPLNLLHGLQLSQLEHIARLLQVFDQP